MMKPFPALRFMLLWLLPVMALPSRAQEIGAPAQDSMEVATKEILPADSQDTVLGISDSLLARLFLFAGELYNGGNYEKALELYRNILVSGYEASALYYNMGNAAFRSNKVGHAVLYYEKALKLEPSHKDAAHNLEYISRYTVDAFDEVPELFLRTWIRSAVKVFPEKTWSILALVFFTLFLCAVLVYLFTRKLAFKKSGFFTALLALVLFVFALLSAADRYRKTTDPDRGIILAPSVVVRSTPSESGTELFVLHEGTKVHVNEEITGWHNIRIVDGREGWITSEDFALI